MARRFRYLHEQNKGPCGGCLPAGGGETLNNQIETLQCAVKARSAMEKKKRIGGLGRSTWGVEGRVRLQL